MLSYCVAYIYKNVTKDPVALSDFAGFLFCFPAWLQVWWFSQKTCYKRLW